MSIKQPKTAGMSPDTVVDDIAPSYPAEVSREWYAKVNRYYDDVDQDLVDVNDVQSAPAAKSFNDSKASSRASLDKPLPALPTPYFEYLFADADITKSAKRVSTTSLSATGQPTYEFVKSPKTNSYDFLKPDVENNPYVDPVKRDSDGFAIPLIPASSYSGAVRESRSIDRMSYIDDNDDPMLSHADLATAAYTGTPPVNVDMSAFVQYTYPQFGVPYMQKGAVEKTLVSAQTANAATSASYSPILGEIFSAVGKTPLPPDKVHAQVYSAVEKTPLPRYKLKAATHPSRSPATGEVFFALEKTPLRLPRTNQPTSPSYSPTESDVSTVIATPEKPAATPDWPEYLEKLRRKAAKDLHDSFKAGLEQEQSPLRGPTMDIRVGVDEEPQPYVGGIREKPNGLTQMALDALDRAMFDVGEYADPPEPVKYYLKPMTYQEPEIKKGIKKLTAKWIARRQCKGQATSIDTSAVESTTSSLKRRARDSFAARSAKINSDESVQYLGTKRVRTQSPAFSPMPAANIPPSSPIYHNAALNIAFPQAGLPFVPGFGLPPSILALTRVSLSTIPAPATIKFITPTTPTPPAYTPLDTTLPRPLTDNYKAFPGQFIGVGLNLITAKTKAGAMKRPKMTTFGDRLHPNGPIIHKACFPAPVEPIWNYDPDTMPRRSPLFRAFEDLDCCNELAGSKNVSMLRTASEENLRREAHMELACARLEGVSVGQYRYYQGHLSVEEYLEKGLCVCWSPCACSRVCSRFGDVMCPCGGDLELEKDSDNDSVL